MHSRGSGGPIYISSPPQQNIMKHLPRTLFKRYLMALCVIVITIIALLKATPRSKDFLVGVVCVMIFSPDLHSQVGVSPGPRFNQFPISYDGQSGDWPLINARN